MTNEKRTDRERAEELAEQLSGMVITKREGFIAPVAAAFAEIRKECEAGWLLIESAPRVHQAELAGFDLEIGWYNMHWRDDKNGWCYTWNQEPCQPTHFMKLKEPLYAR